MSMSESHMGSESHERDVKLEDDNSVMIEPAAEIEVTLPESDIGNESSAQVDDALMVDGELNKDAKEMQEIHRTFSNVLNEFEGNSSVEIILEEYKKMYEMLKESRAKQRKYIFDNTNLRCEIKNNAEKVQLALHLSQEDKEIIKTLSKQVHQAWNEAEVMSEREGKARSVIIKLQDEISQLTYLVEEGMAIQELQSVAQLAVNERKELEESLLSLRSDLEFKDLKIQEIQERLHMRDESAKREVNDVIAMLKANEKKFNELVKKLQETEDQCRMLERVRTNLTAENANVLLDLDSIKLKLNRLEKEEAEYKTDIVKLTHQYTEAVELNSEKSKEISRLTNDVELLKKRVNNLNQTNVNLKERLEDRDVCAKTCERNLKRRETEVEELANKNIQTAHTIKNLYNQLSQREEVLKKEKETVDGLHMTLNDAQIKLIKVQNTIGEYKRLADFSKQTNIKLSDQKSALQKSVDLKEKVNVTLIKELNDLTQQLNKAIDTVEALESDKERLYGRINTILEMVNSLASDNENKEAKLMMLLKVNNEQETSINHINTKLFRMTNQRDNISNELHLIQLKNDELNMANVNFSKQSTSLAEDLLHKEQEFDKMHNTNSSLRNEIRALENEVIKWQDHIRQKQNKINDLEGLVRTMDGALCKKEQDIGKLRLVLDQMVNQRNLLGYQCLQKKEQIQLLTEKNKLMQNIFSVGNKSYNHQNKTIHQLKINMNNLMRQKNSLINKLENIENYKSKLGLANQQLVGALARSLAMEGEHPFNLHRWRHLKAVDISQYEMILKVHYLLKRVITKTDEVTHLEHVIVEKTEIVNEMKRILQRRPGMEIVMRAKEARLAKEDMSRKLKAAVAERNLSLNKLDHQVARNRQLVERVSEEKKKNNVLNKNNIQLKTKVSILPSIGAVQMPMKRK